MCSMQSDRSRALRSTAGARWSFGDIARATRNQGSDGPSIPSGRGGARAHLAVRREARLPRRRLSPGPRARVNLGPRNPSGRLRPAAKGREPITETPVEGSAPAPRSGATPAERGPGRDAISGWPTGREPMSGRSAEKQCPTLGRGAVDPRSDPRVRGRRAEALSVRCEPARRGANRAARPPGPAAKGGEPEVNPSRAARSSGPAARRGEPRQVAGAGRRGTGNRDASSATTTRIQSPPVRRRAEGRCEMRANRREPERDGGVRAACRHGLLTTPEDPRERERQRRTDSTSGGDAAEEVGSPRPPLRWRVGPIPRHPPRVR